MSLGQGCGEADLHLKSQGTRWSSKVVMGPYVVVSPGLRGLSFVPASGTPAD